jgi:hypothetical protein
VVEGCPHCDVKEADTGALKAVYRVRAVSRTLLVDTIAISEPRDGCKRDRCEKLQGDDESGKGSTFVRITPKLLLWP